MAHTQYDDPVVESHTGMGIFNCRGLFAVTLFVFTGTANTVLGKVMYQGGMQLPWTLNWAMEFGMMLSLPLYALSECWSRRRQPKRSPHAVAAPIGEFNEDFYHVIEAPTKSGSMRRHLEIFLRVLPAALCDTTSGILMNIGLVGLSASTWQMLRGSLIFFTLFIRWGIMRIRPLAYESVGVLLTTIGLVIVGIAGVYHNEFAVRPSIELICLGLTLLSQLILALQAVIEEVLLHKYDVHEMQLVGMEGTWGVIFNTAILAAVRKLPQGGCWTAFSLHEDFLWIFDGSSYPTWVVFMLLVFVVNVMAYNISGQMVTKLTSATTHTVLDSVRTVTIWVVMLVLYYSLDGLYHRTTDTPSTTPSLWPTPVAPVSADEASYCASLMMPYNGDNPWGEELTLWSLCELAGFVVMCAGILLYNRVFEIHRCFTYPAEPMEAVDGPDGYYDDHAFEYPVHSGTPADQHPLLGAGR
eukprot:TRINITY_DN70121_c0_g1_i1.p1 TRINITY_DN70121_c0_g1~~TRINITY_DN70121_c0_g1_i1.p1  ORF type:complete len:469 (-),score=80.03 TRINITY_DN70121_c0_g1_i1:169-1575(-)